MKTIICGSRTIENKALLKELILYFQLKLSSIISGGARGADKIGEDFAKENSIPLTIIKAEWDIYGKYAGYRRNKQMAEIAEAVIALWNGESKGTKNMIDIAKRKGLPIFVCQILDDEGKRRSLWRI